MLDFALRALEDAVLSPEWAPTWIVFGARSILASLVGALCLRAYLKSQQLLEHEKREY